MRNALAWLGPLGRRTPVPVHLLAIGAVPNLFAQGMLWLGLLVKLLAIPTMLLLATQGHAWLAMGLGVLLFGLVVAQTRRPRSCAEPLRDDAIFLAGVALMASLAIGWAEALPAVVIGVCGGVLAAVTIAGLMFVTWGHAPSFVEMRRRTLRILGDNPDALTAITRVRVDERGLILTLPRTARGPITLAVNKPSMKVVASVPWSELRGPLEANEQVRVFLGAREPTNSETDFRIVLPAGRYIVSVRNYRPFDRDRLPEVQRAGAA